MPDFKKCWIISEDDATPDQVGWGHTLDEPPFFLWDYKHNGVEVVCPCCFLNTGLYKTEAEAEARWNNLFLRPITLADYKALDYRAKFPDHIEPSTKIRTNG